MGRMEVIDDMINRNRDPRIDGYYSMDTVWLSACLCIGYFIVVTKIGPWFMQNRQPYEIKSIMIVYNFAMVGLCSYMMYEFLMSGWATGYTLGCQLVDTSYSPKAIRMANVCYLFYLSKYLEFFDTIFFIMRKKYSHVSFLHVFHHGIMPVSWWFVVKLSPGGFATFHALLNSFIHVVMYLYYGISALGPEFQKYVWWKKYLTKMQLIQFFLVTIHSSQLFFTSCEYPKQFAIWILAYAVIFFGLFTHFYIKAYKSKAEAHKNGSVRHQTNGTTKGSGNGISDKRD